MIDVPLIFLKKTTQLVLRGVDNDTECGCYRETCMTRIGNPLFSTAGMGVRPFTPAATMQGEPVVSSSTCFISSGDEFGGGGDVPKAPDLLAGSPSILSRPENAAASPPEAAVEPLIKALADRDTDVRRAAAEVLGNIGDSRAVEPLIKALGGVDWYKGDSAAVSLGKLGAPAVEPLIKALGDKNWRLRCGAAEALGNIGDSRAVEPLIKALGDSEGVVRSRATISLCKLGDARAVEPLITELGNYIDDNSMCERITWALGEFGEKNLIDRSLLALVQQRSTFAEDQIDSFKKIAEKLQLSDVLEFLRGKAFRETIGEKIVEITTSIKEHIAEALGLDGHMVASTGEGNSSYGNVSMGHSLRLEQRLEQRLELLPENTLEIDDGTSLEEAMEVTRTLNFLVHHEMAHVIYEYQKNRVHEPKVSAPQFRHLDLEKVGHNANEIVIDKIGFDAARKIYVHGDGDVAFDDDTREVVSIAAYRTLAQRVLRYHVDGSNSQSAEVLARMSAVLSELAGSDAISQKVKNELTDLSAKFFSASAAAADATKTAELKTLIALYRKIFRETRLEV